MKASLSECVYVSICEVCPKSIFDEIRLDGDALLPSVNGRIFTIYKWHTSKKKIFVTDKCLL